VDPRRQPIDELTREPRINPPMAAPFTMTQDFRHEFEADTLKLLRKRFLWFLGTVASIYGLILLIVVVGFVALALGVNKDLAAKQLTNLRGGYWGLMAFLVLTGLDVGVFVWCAKEATARRNNRERLLKLTYQFFMYRGAADLLSAMIFHTEGFPWYLGMYHTLGCALLPWTPTQALRPMLFLLPLNAVTLFISSKYGWTGDVFWSVFSCFCALPGLGIAWAKTTRRSNDMRMRFLQDRYGQMRRELVDARRIHEALFPKPFNQDKLRFSYRYEPMRQIGGDYLYARFSPSDGETEPPFNILLIDVTGHGIAAALTVNRLYGEVERLFAEDPFASPADVLSALNRYVNLTLSRHSVYATALCIRVDIEKDTIEYASGGHPPAFLCSADGRIEDLDSTSYVLGAVGAGDFDAGMRSLKFMPGDALVAYTDGAIEARNEEGRMLGVFGFQRALATCLGSGGSNAACELAASLLSLVEQHRSGPPEDDTLVVELARTVRGLRVDLPPGDGGGSERSAPVLPATFEPVVVAAAAARAR
jgi:serine phosphatase RsbU (regulator of sigma subunit)